MLLDEKYFTKEPLSHPLLCAIGQIRESKGCLDFYKHHFPKTLGNLKESIGPAKPIDSGQKGGMVDYFLERRGIKGRSQEEFSGYSLAMSHIHQKYIHEPFTPQLVLEIHRDLYKYVKVKAGRWKEANNHISLVGADGSKKVIYETVEHHKIPLAMDMLHERFLHMVSLNKFEPLLLIGAYILEFLNHHPLNDGNGRVSRLLTVLLLSKFGYDVGFYVNYEDIMEKLRVECSDSLTLSRSNPSPQGSLLPWWEFFASSIRLSYQKLQNRLRLIETLKESDIPVIL